MLWHACNCYIRKRKKIFDFPHYKQEKTSVSRISSSWRTAWQRANRLMHRFAQKQVCLVGTRGRLGFLPAQRHRRRRRHHHHLGSLLYSGTSSSGESQSVTRAVGLLHQSSPPPCPYCTRSHLTHILHAFTQNRMCSTNNNRIHWLCSPSRIKHSSFICSYYCKTQTRVSAHHYVKGLVRFTHNNN